MDKTGLLCAKLFLTTCFDPEGKKRGSQKLNEGEVGGCTGHQ